MPITFVLPVSMVFAATAWALAFRWYVTPALDKRSFEDALRPLLLLHTFRFVGLMFLVPGVTALPLDPRFSVPAAWGDLIAAVLAFAALAALERDRRLALTMVWVFNVWGFIDLLNAVGRGVLYTPDGALGAAFWIPAVIVPLLLVTHVYIFKRLVGEREDALPA